MEEIVTIVTAVDSKDVLERIGRHLVEKRLVACIQIVGPVKSIYWWKGAMEEAEEWLGIMKSRKSLYHVVEREIKALHPYELPEIVALKIDQILDPYREWVIRETEAVRRP